MERQSDLNTSIGTLFLKQQFESIYTATTAEFKHYIPYDKFIEIAVPFVEDVTQFERTYEAVLQQSKQTIWLDTSKSKAIVVTFNHQSEIESLFLTPFMIDEQANNRYTKNKYHYPFKGEWFVFWGGANELINYHYAYETQQFAYDFVKVQDGLTYIDTAEHNEHYLAYNEAIVAPLDGKVLEVVDGIADNVPGQMDEQNPAGNYVILEHANQEYSLLAHLIPGSIVVKEGQQVKTGTRIGRCGNSGNSSEAHLHFQVMDAPNLTKCKSRRIRFHDGKEPIQGDTVVSKKMKKSMGEKAEHLDLIATLAEVLMLIPRAIWRFIQ